MEIKKALVLESNKPLSKAMGELIDTGTAVVVTKDNRYYGIVDDRHIRQGITDPGRTKLETLAVRPPVILPSTTLAERINAFLAGHFKALPVVDETRKVVGITTRAGVLQEMLDAGIIPKARVSEFMNSPVYTVEENEHLGKAKTLMKEYNTRRLLVVSNGKPVGLISTLDLMAYMREPKCEYKRPMVVKTRESMANKPLAEFIRSDVTTEEETATLEDIVKKMIKKSVSSVVILSNGKPVGVVSAHDLFKGVYESRTSEREITVSGLGTEHAHFHDVIKKRISAMVEKFSRSFDIGNIRVNAKENKKTFAVQLHLETDGKYLSLSHEGYDLVESIDALAAELGTILRKMKEKRRTKKRRVHSGAEEV